MKVYDRDWKLDDTISWIRDLEDWTEGAIATQYGIVAVYTQGDARFEYSSRLDFVHNARLYTRSFKGKRYSHRGLVTKAKEFARHVTEGGNDEDGSD